jgi:nanoRNase/pAp phosphatase (c-di-AMP/oligoRNAs hydrolase)
MLADKLCSLKVKGRVLILPHDNPDPDALASAWGISLFIKKILGVSAEIGYIGLIGRAENRALVEVLTIPIKKIDLSDFENYGTIVMVDSQPYTGNSSLPDDMVPDAVIDHHPQRDTTKARQWTLIKEHTGATSTLIAAALFDKELILPKKLATALFYAIRSETKDLGWEGTRLDYQTYLGLLPHVDFGALYRIEHPRLSPAYYQILKQAINRSRVYDFLVVCPLGEVPYPELPAEIADFLIFRRDVDISFVMGRHGQDLYLSMRSFHRDANSADILQKLLQGLGTGGGHEITAGGRIPDVSLERAKDLEKELVKKIVRVFGLNRKKAQKLYQEQKIDPKSGAA